MPTDSFTADLHCVTRWSKLGTSWKGVSLDTMLAGVKTNSSYAMMHSYGDYTTNLPLVDLMNKQAWIAFRFDGKDLAPEHGGPARLLVPHLYLWKSAKWVRGMQALMDGGTPAAKEIADRIEGKPPQRMEIVETERKVVTLEVIFRKKISETPSE